MRPKDTERAQKLCALGAISGSMATTLLHWTYVQELVRGYAAGTLSAAEEKFLIHFGQYIGNNETVFAMLSTIFVVDFPWFYVQRRLQLSADTEARLVSVREKLLPALLLLVTLVLLVDAETSQIVAPALLSFLAKFSLSAKTLRTLFLLIQGTPVVADIVGGLFGAATFLPAYMMYKKYMRTDMADMLDATIKVFSGGQVTNDQAAAALFVSCDTSPARASQNSSASDLPCSVAK